MQLFFLIVLATLVLCLVYSVAIWWQSHRAQSSINNGLLAVHKSRDRYIKENYSFICNEVESLKHASPVALTKYEMQIDNMADRAIQAIQAEIVLSLDRVIQQFEWLQQHLYELEHVPRARRHDMELGLIDCLRGVVSSFSEMLHPSEAILPLADRIDDLAIDWIESAQNTHDGDILMAVVVDDNSSDFMLAELIEPFEECVWRNAYYAPPPIKRNIAAIYLQHDLQCALHRYEALKEVFLAFAKASCNNAKVRCRARLYRLRQSIALAVHAESDRAIAKATEEHRHMLRIIRSAKSLLDDDKLRLEELLASYIGDRLRALSGDILSLPEELATISAMTLSFDCPVCHSRIRVEAEHCGSKGRCPKCLSVMRIPALNQEKENLK